MTAYYNEHDPFAAAWLRELIADRLIAPGEVDERDIQDVTPDELRSFRQCHFFAGIGIWSAALRGAGWEDEREVWTASCPCQPFSQAGEGSGFADERHLWPAFYHLASQCRPPVVFGEQVASKDGLAWIDLVSSDMEAAGYSGGAIDLCSAGFGAPHIRQRLYFVWMADAADNRHERAGSAWRWRDGLADQRAACRLADADGGHPGAEGLQRGGQHGLGQEDPGYRGSGVPGPVNGIWRDADWILCRDPDGPKWRPVAPGSFPLVATGELRNRLAEIRGAGNSLTLAVAQGFIAEVMAVMDRQQTLAA